ncbi:hypothetical protein [Bosea sp. TAF32]|uniref:hypothetical protein n=1 Tax=Bosea sp. TAF32 TaxID=3237482 RepID=UPI003F9037E4
MAPLRDVLIAGLGLAMAGWGSVQPASAQYYAGPNYDRSYERRPGDGYESRGYGRNDDRRDWRDDRRGYGRDDARGDRRDDRRPGYDGGRRQQDPMAGMTMEERKRAIKNEREAQKKAFKRGLLFN